MTKFFSDSTLELRKYFQEVANKYLEARRQPFANHPIQRLISRDIPEALANNYSFLNNYKVVGSAGQGNWARVPWLAFLHKEETSSTQKGVYVVYLFAEDMSKLYLTIMNGVTSIYSDNSKREGDALLLKLVNEQGKKIKQIERDKGLNFLIYDSKVELGTSDLGIKYASGVSAYLKYELDSLPNHAILENDLKRVIAVYEKYLEVKSGGQFAGSQQESEEGADILPTGDNDLPSKELIDHIYQYINAKGFIFSREDVANFFLSLKTKPFVILAGISGTGKSKLVELFAEAVGATAQNGRYCLIPVRPDWNDSTDLLGYVNLQGEFIAGRLTEIIRQAQANPEYPYFVCLDEMNLARVEYYFSDFLSVIESRRKDNAKITSATVKIPGLTGEDIGFPENLYIVGTVNMDETTHPFSRKVLDRANTIEFSQVNLNVFPDNLNKIVEPRIINNRLFRSEYLTLKDCYGGNEIFIKEKVQLLSTINSLLEYNGIHVGYRVRDEFCFYLLYNSKFDLIPEEQAVDFQIMQKILPRIQGSSQGIEKTLNDLAKACSHYRLSAAKIAFMLRRYQDDNFTSYWV